MQGFGWGIQPYQPVARLIKWLGSLARPIPHYGGTSFPVIALSNPGEDSSTKIHKKERTSCCQHITVRPHLAIKTLQNQERNLVIPVLGKPHGRSRCGVRAPFRLAASLGMGYPSNLWCASFLSACLRLSSSLILESSSLCSIVAPLQPQNCHSALRTPTLSLYPAVFPTPKHWHPQPRLGQRMSYLAVSKIGRAQSSASGVGLHGEGARSDSGRPQAVPAAWHALWTPPRCA